MKEKKCSVCVALAHGGGEDFCVCIYVLYTYVYTFVTRIIIFVATLHKKAKRKREREREKKKRSSSQGPALFFVNSSAFISFLFYSHTINQCFKRLNFKNAYVFGFYTKIYQILEIIVHTYVHILSTRVKVYDNSHNYFHLLRV